MQRYSVTLVAQTRHGGLECAWGSGLAEAVTDESHREAAIITFLVTLSAVVMAGVGSAFWGVMAGAIALFMQQYGQAAKAKTS